MPCASSRELGLQEALAAHAIETRELAFYSRHGQFIYKEPRGRFAGYDWPQLSIHRADLHKVMLDTVRARLGGDAVRLAHRCLKVDQDGAGVVIHFDNSGAAARQARGGLRRHPFGAAPATLSRPGTTPLFRRQHVARRGALAGLSRRRHHGLDGLDDGRQDGDLSGAAGHARDRRPALINWVAEIERPEAVRQDWTGRGRLGDIMPAFAGLKFDWLDISGMIESTEEILEYPMVDRDPLPRWSFGRITLLGDAAHPMYPRGSNGAGQAILDARFLTGQIRKLGATPEALQHYEAVRNPATAKVVLTNRTDPPDAILREVWQRSGGRRFERIEDVISSAELEAISERYKKVAGFDRETLKTRPSFV